MINNNLVTVINATTFTEIKIPNCSFVRPISYYTDDESNWIEADDITGTNPTTVPGTTKVNQRISGNNKTGAALYIKASEGTPNFVVKIGIPER